MAPIEICSCTNNALTTESFMEGAVAHLARKGFRPLDLSWVGRHPLALIGWDTYCFDTDRDWYSLYTWYGTPSGIEAAKGKWLDGVMRLADGTLTFEPGWEGRWTEFLPHRVGLLVCPDPSFDECAADRITWLRVAQAPGPLNQRLGQDLIHKR